MTQTLKKQLTAMCVASLCGGAIWWNSGASRAQSPYDDPGFQLRVKVTREEAALSFTQGLGILSDSVRRFESENPQLLLAISSKSERELGEGRDRLLLLLANQWKYPSQIVKVQSEGDKTATVIVEANANPPARPLVLVEENGNWGVDLVETYAKWNGLEGVAKFESIYKLTGVVLDGMPISQEIRRSQCQTNLKQIALGVAQYVQDYDEKYPLAKPWIDVVKPYVKSEAIFNCPALPKGARYGYAYNSKLSSKAEMQVAQTSLTVELYETSVLKRNAYGIGENTAFRHDGGANYGFADGHIKWFKQGAAPSFNLGNGKPPIPAASPPIGGPPDE